MNIKIKTMFNHFEMERELFRRGKDDLKSGKFLILMP